MGSAADTGFPSFHKDIVKMAPESIRFPEPFSTTFIGGQTCFYIVSPMPYGRAGFRIRYTAIQEYRQLPKWYPHGGRAPGRAV